MKVKKHYLEIAFKNGKKCPWDAGKEFTDYNYDGKCLIIKKHDRLVGIYPLMLLSASYFFNERG